MGKHVRFLLPTTVILYIVTMAARAQPVQVTDIPNSSSNFTTVGELVYFTAGDELWRTDGTADGTIFLKSGFDGFSTFQEFNGKLIFRSGKIPDPSRIAWNELWASDGTPSGTVILKTSTSFDVSVAGATSSNLFFHASESATGGELYRTDGTAAGTALVKDIYPGVADGFRGHSAAVGNLLFFAANDGTSGTELWKTDGTAPGTVMVRDINPGTGNGVGGPEGNVFSLNNLFYFRGFTSEIGSEPWVSDGSSEGTTILQDISPGAGSPGKLEYRIANNGFVYFLLWPVNDDPSRSGPADLWKSSGTVPSTSKIETVGVEEFNNEYHSFLIYNDKVHFFNRWDFFSDDLWQSDGTAEGTYPFAGFETMDGRLSYFDEVNNYLIFTGSFQAYPTPFYRTNGGSAEEFYRLKSKGFHGGDRSVIDPELTTVGDLAFFADHDGPSDDDSGAPDSEEDYFHLMQTDGFITQSMRTLHGVSTIGTDNIVNFNGKVIFTTRNDQFGSTDTQEKLWIYDPAKPSEGPGSFTLVNADTDEDIKTINDGDIITKSEGSSINIRYNPVETPGSVRFSLNGANVRTENAPPYSLAGDVNGDYFTWEGAVPGSYDITATPYSESGGNGTPGTPHSVSFTIEEETSSGPCTASGSILREYWEGVSGSRVSDIPLHTAPTSTSQLSSFEGPTNSGTSYGARIKGYICPPSAGEYIFWIASNDHSELWLSTDDNPVNKVRIAFVEGATTPQEWTKFSSQKSAVISLNAGQRYYIEALHKQGAGTDNLAVGWQLPNGTLERPIPGNRLSPAGAVENSVPTVAIENPKEGETFNSPTSVSLYAIADDVDGSVTKVEFFADSEKLGEGETTSSEDLYKYIWENVPPGTHTITATATDNSGGTGTSAPVTFSVTGVACAATGFITRDYWANVTGSRVSDIPVNSPPTSTTELNIFEGPSNVGTHYASRIRGYVCPPTTGNYTFWIASNDHSELWLSSVADDPSAKQRIAFAEGATGPQQWTKFSSQRSEPVMLEQGKRYYVEALHKQGVGTDHLAVGWMLPNFKSEKPIPGRHLSPFDMNQAARVATEATTSEDKAMYSEINIYPNPLPTSNAQLTISGYEGIDEVIETQVEIINFTGEVVYKERIRCGGDCKDHLMDFNEQLAPGLYMVNMLTNGTQLSKRLLVK